MTHIGTVLQFPTDIGRDLGVGLPDNNMAHFVVLCTMVAHDGLCLGMAFNLVSGKPHPTETPYKGLFVGELSFELIKM